MPTCKYIDCRDFCVRWMVGIQCDIRKMPRIRFYCFQESGSAGVLHTRSSSSTLLIPNAFGMRNWLWRRYKLTEMKSGWIDKKNCIDAIDTHTPTQPNDDWTTWSFKFSPNKFNLRTKSPHLLNHVDPKTLSSIFFLESETTIESAMSAQNDTETHKKWEEKVSLNKWSTISLINVKKIEIKASRSLHGISNCILCYCFNFESLECSRMDLSSR